MAQCEHTCGTCKHMWFDSEILKVCPLCSSPDISNVPDETWDKDDDEPQEDEHGKELFL